MNSDCYQINAGGQTWTVELHPSADVVLEFAGRKWPMQAAKVTSNKGAFLISHYEMRMWRHDHRPFERDYWIAFNLQHEPIVRASTLCDVLWSLATGRSPSELPDEECTAILQPQHERGQDQHSDTRENAQHEQARTQGRGSMWQRLMGMARRQQ